MSFGKIPDHPSNAFPLALLGSVFLHVFLFAFVLFFATFKANEAIPSTKITFLRLSSKPVLETKKISPVTQPEKIEVVKTSEQKSPEKKVVPLPIEKKKEAAIEKKTKSLNTDKRSVARPTMQEKSSTNKPQAPQAKPSSAEEKEALAKINETLQKREVSTANSSGSPQGTPAGNISASDPSIAQYRAMVKTRVRSNLSWQAGTGEQILRTSIGFQLSASGSLISASFRKRSGNGSFDEACMRAVQRSNPFPPPPPGAISQGFLVEFRKRM